MSAMPTAKRQQILDLLDQEPSNHRISQIVGVSARAVGRYRAGHIPTTPGGATNDQCRNSHPFPEFRRITETGQSYCIACRREQRNASWLRTQEAKRKTKPQPGPRPDPPALPLPGEWRTYALCRTEEPELFFPLGTTAAALLQTEKARAICHRCPALDACATWALDNRIDHGMWGGYDERERRAIHRKRDRAKARERTA